MAALVLDLPKDLRTQPVLPPEISKSPLDFRFLFAILACGRGNGKQVAPAPLPSRLSRAGSRLLNSALNVPPEGVSDGRSRCFMCPIQVPGHGPASSTLLCAPLGPSSL